MARYSSGVLTTAGSATLPIMSLYATAAVAPHLREVGITNSTATAVVVKLTLLTTAATQGAGLVEAMHDPGAGAAVCTAFTTHSSTGPTLGSDLGYRSILPAQIGAGIIWTFGDMGISVPLGTGNGIGVIPEGTGQACYVYMVWDE